MLSVAEKIFGRAEREPGESYREPDGYLSRRSDHCRVGLLLSCCAVVTTRRFFADILLTPLEATRIRLVSNPKVGLFSIRKLVF